MASLALRGQVLELKSRRVSKYEAFDYFGIEKLQREGVAKEIEMLPAQKTCSHKRGKDGKPRRTYPFVKVKELCKRCAKGSQGAEQEMHERVW